MDGVPKQGAIEPRLLFVSFPVDLGSLAMESMIMNLVAPELDVRLHRFAVGDMRQNVNKRVRTRFQDAPRLWTAIAAARHERRRILFQHTSPALFGSPLLRAGSYSIIADWTRRLFDPDHGSPGWLSAIHTRVATRSKSVLCCTDAVMKSFGHDYGVPRSKLVKVNMPFDTRDLPALRRPDRDQKRLLFVGGDLHRKGGDELLRWFASKPRDNVSLTMVTDAKAHALAGVRYIGGVKPGSSRQRSLFQEHDVLVLPTLRDAYPIVLGEAAAAGLAIMTTRFALGAPEVVDHGFNGFVLPTQSELFSALERLLDDENQIWRMKQHSRHVMETRFSMETTFSQLSRAIFQ